MKESGFLLTEALGYSCEFSIYSQEPTFLLPTIDGIFKSDQTLFLGVYTDKGALIHGQEKTSEGFIDQIPDFVMRRALKGENVIIEGETSEGVKFYDFFVPVKANIMASGEEEEIIGIARIGTSLEKIKRDSLSLIFLGVAINLIAAGMLFFLARILAGTVTKPIDALSKGAKEFGKGNLDYRIDADSSDEIERLAKAFNGMAENLSESQKSLKDRIEQLEKFHKVTVGRELRMSDLKKRIKELEEENRQIREKEEE